MTVELLGPKPGAFWIIVRGRTIHADSGAAAVAIPGTNTWDLPTTARLRTVETSDVPLQPAESLKLWNSTAEQSGAGSKIEMQLRECHQVCD